MSLCSLAQKRGRANRRDPHPQYRQQHQFRLLDWLLVPQRSWRRSQAQTRAIYE